MDISVWIDSRRKAHALPGLAVAIVHGGKVEMLSGFGSRDAAGASVTADTRFPIASCTKTFTAAAIAADVASGKIQWKSRVADVLRGFRLADGSEKTLTLWDALTHRGPLPPHTWAWVYGEMPRPEWIQKRLPYLATYLNNPKPHRYSNILYAVLGEVVEQMAQRPFEEHIRDTLLKPCGLNRTGFLTEHWLGEDSDTAHPFRRSVDGPVELPPFHAAEKHLIAPASEMIASISDAARWLSNRLEHGIFLPTDQTPCLVNDERPYPGLGTLYYACGWRMETFHGENHFFHTGQCTGYTSLFSLLPDRQMAIAILSNANGVVDEIQEMGYALLARWTGLPPPPLSVAYKPPSLPSPRIALKPPPPGLFPEGIFADAGYGELECMLSDGRLLAHFQAQPVTLGVDEESRPCIELPDYGVRFPVKIEPDALSIPFEHAVAAIRFVRVK